MSKDTATLRQNLPPELQARPQWVLWKNVKKRGKDVKVPFQPNGQEAETNNPSTWSSFETVLSAYQTEQYNGIGYVFSQSDPYIGIDFDDCFPLSEKLQTWIQSFSSYTEISQSGKGLHVIIKGKKAFSRCQFTLYGHKIEVYEKLRYFALTGDLLDPSLKTIIEGKDALDDLYCEWLPPAEPTKRRKSPLPYQTTDEFVNDVLTVLSKKGQRLFSCYEDFLRLAYALKSQGIDYNAFDSIVTQSEHYDPVLNFKIWGKLNPKHITFGTAYFYAQQADRDYLEELFKARRPQIPTIRNDAKTLLQGVKKHLQTPNPQPPEQDEHGNLTYSLRPGQYVSDLDIEFQDGFTLVHSETGTGKTSMIPDYAKQHPEMKIVALYPTKFILEQQVSHLEKRDISVNKVMEGHDFDYDEQISYSTIDSFVEKYNPALLPETVVFFDEYHCMISAASHTYKGRMLSKVDRLLQEAKKVIGLTATPIHLYEKHDPPRTITIHQPAKVPDSFQVLLFEDPIKAIETKLMPGKTTFVEINSKDSIKRLALYFQEKGLKVGTIYRTEDKDGTSDLYEHIKDNSGIPEGYDLILTTCLFELGIDIKGCDVGNVLIFPHKRLDTRHQTENVTAPHEVKQYINRFRDTRPQQTYLLRPIYQRNDPTGTFDGEIEYHFKYARALADVKDFNHQIKAGRFRWHIKRARDDVSEESAYLTRYNPDVEQFEVNPVGINYLIWTYKQDTMTRNFDYYIEQLVNNSMRTPSRPSKYKKKKS
jgi:hypothetical protein